MALLTKKDLIKKNAAHTYMLLRRCCHAAPYSDRIGQRMKDTCCRLVYTLTRRCMCMSACMFDSCNLYTICARDMCK